uniref:Uncharacterized protein n=1 Tax=Anguilla anguilla TaxID=7936 RepID=A0A0E9WEK6_ANGAN
MKSGFIFVSFSPKVALDPRQTPGGYDRLLTGAFCSSSVSRRQQPQTRPLTRGSKMRGSALSGTSHSQKRSQANTKTKSNRPGFSATG